MSEALVTVTVTDILDAGADGMAQVCQNEDGLVLVDQLGGNPDLGGMWFDNSTGGQVNGVFDATLVPLGSHQLDVHRARFRNLRSRYRDAHGSCGRRAFRRERQ